MVNILVNSSHGNAPAVIGVSIAQEIAAQYRAVGVDTRIVVPNIYGREERILKEEGLWSGSVVLDDTIGALHREILFQGDFNAQMVGLLKGRWDIEQKLRRQLKTYGRIDLELNIGSHLTSGALTVLAYPCTYSELYQRTLDVPELQSKFDQGLLEQLLECMEKVDEHFEVEYVPSYNPFSFDEFRTPRRKELSTPPLRNMPTPATGELPENVVYCMMPGTGVERDAILDRARAFRDAGHTVYVPPWVTDTEFERRKPLDVVPHKNTRAVLSRAGWGTIYLCQVTGKSLITVPFEDDEPEVYFNARTLQCVELGKASKQQLRTFGTLNGCSFVAHDIIRRFPQIR